MSDQEHLTMEQRDALQEAKYAFDREHHHSVLSYVGANQDELAREYLDWRLYSARESVRADLSLWEHHRFGAELYPAAHGVLLCAVLCMAYPDDPKSRLIRGESDYKRRMNAGEVIE